MSSTSKIIVGILVATLMCVWVNNKINADRIAYEDINPTYSTAFDYENFIEKYPESEYVKNAYECLLTIADRAGTIQALQNYIDQYPNSHLIGEVRKTVENKCSVLYAHAVQKNSVDAWKEYMHLTPASYHKDAESRLKDAVTRLIIIEKEKWGTDYRAWKQANIENTIASFKKYLKLYPKGNYAYTADRKVIDLQVENVFAKEHGSLPSMDKTSYGYGSNTSIEVYNNTSYTLTLLYSGTSSKKLVLSPHSRDDLSLTNGEYRIAASVDASNIRNFAGKEELNGGNYNVEYYIQTQRY